MANLSLQVVEVTKAETVEVVVAVEEVDEVVEAVEKVIGVALTQGIAQISSFLSQFLFFFTYSVRFFFNN